ncbi:methyltransferase domain-containing protein [Paenibacillus sp. KQZ6P-2]|uniref:Methyltransferase domain-containing protein n=1 Tax=Paenibacillus mangrovi TaxID=2931978 RepID=A0A9X2B337_9BACL|nr:SAM-dependent methyltransferase [Paenibacillus mangrovi]MCJ8012540.1 methyltransferase domain-containing protein [Paenibacillus mangrovi]
MDDKQLTNEETNNEISRFICTANHGFAPYAQEELRRRFGKLKSKTLISGEAFLVTFFEAADRAVDMIVSNPPIFLRHIQPVQLELPTDTEDAFAKMVQFLVHMDKLHGAKVSLQVRKADNSVLEDNAGALRENLQGKLAELNAEFVVRDAQWVISVFAAEDRLYIGVSEPEHNLSDWSGGAIRFQREEGQISRAKFKLLEAEQSFGIDFASFETGLDIGAAPGGWTSFLLERGLRVTAVDPAFMHESLQNHPSLRIFKKNASEVHFRDSEFDLLVCDMSWSPKQMVKLVTELLPSLRAGGTAIVTVKLMHKKPMALIDDVILSFEHANMQVQRAKQLFHNRDEITLYMIKY